tara:strand:- start:531 stop:758 length:228 start_codon:yes stop_codon:yes gene_type:complete
MSELQIVKRDGTLYKTSVSVLARQISVELKEKFTILDQNFVFMEKGELDTGQVSNPKIINAVLDAVENLIGEQND